MEIDNREYVETNVGRFKREPCEVEGCNKLGEPCWIDSHQIPDAWVCVGHLKQQGFCVGCHQFYAGIESFDFGPGWCSNCAPEFEDEEMYDDDLDFGFLEDYD